MIPTHKYSFILFLLLVMAACQEDVVFNTYKSVDKTGWGNGEVVAIDIPVQDSLSYYNLFINLRNNKDYPYSNLFLITRMTFPDRTKVTDTLEYEMTDVKGYFLGSGFSDLKENKLFYKSHIRFPQTGTYLFEVKHAMRQRNSTEGVDPLKGVTDVGISMEKSKK